MLGPSLVIVFGEYDMAVSRLLLNELSVAGYVH